MKKALSLLGLCCLGMSIAAYCADGPMAKVGAVETLSDSKEMVLRLGGCGGVYFLAPKGPLNITFMKQERTSRESVVRGVLFAPDRRVLADFWIPGKGDGEKERSVQKVDLSYNVTEPGVYGLCVTCVGDRYGTSVRWGFTTNCPKYMIETSRGHKDARHEEPIVLTNGNVSGSVTFWPNTKAFSLEMAEVGKEGTPVRVLDGNGSLVTEARADKEGKLSCQFQEDSARKAPWTIELSRMNAVINMDNLTRWDKNTDFRDLSMWTDKRSAWFDYYTNRKLLMPYSCRMYVPAGKTDTVTFKLENGWRENKKVTLSLEFPEGTTPFTSLDNTEFILPGNASTPVTLKVPSPVNGPVSCRLRVISGDFTTYSTLTVLSGAKDKDYKFDIPLDLEPYNHQNERFAYMPNYPVLSQPYFDLDNRPFVLEGRVKYLDNGQWKSAILKNEQGDVIPMRTYGSKIAFDADNWVYVIVRTESEYGLAYSSDHGHTFTFAGGNFNGDYDIEQFSGHNMPPGPPPVVTHLRTDKNTVRERRTFWRALHDFNLHIPVKKDGKITFLPPVLVTKKSIGVSHHSGIPSTVVSFGDKTHLIWGEATDPDDKSIPGVPTFLATYDHKTGVLGKAVLIGYGPPANDVHNTPCVTIDSKGYIHALIGTHGRTFKYARSLKPNTVEGGWTVAKDVGDNLSQTYLGLVCDKQDRLHLLFRLFMSVSNPLAGGRFPAGTIGTLCMMSKDAMADEWTAPKPIVRAPFPDYSVFYHRLIIDRQNRFYISFDYWSTYWFYRKDQNGSRRCLITSADCGESWSMASDFN